MATKKMEQALLDVEAGADMRDAAVDNRVSLDELAREWHRRKRSQDGRPAPKAKQPKQSKEPKPEPEPEDAPEPTMPDALAGWQVADAVPTPKTGGSRSKWAAPLHAFAASGLSCVSLECESGKRAMLDAAGINRLAKRDGVAVRAYAREGVLYMCKEATS